MGDGTGIEWCDASWPVVNGCRRVSPGCENCYAERLIATRLSKQPKYRGLAVFKAGGPRWTGESRLWAPHLAWPLTWKKPRKIFVVDMGDLFFEEVTNEEIAAVFGVMAACPQHTFQVLTKRAERMREWFRWVANEPAGKLHDALGFAMQHQGDWDPDDSINERLLDAAYDTWPLPNVWLGVSVEDQRRADERIPVLLDTPAAVRWVSAEPLLGPVDLRAVKTGCAWWAIGCCCSGPRMPRCDLHAHLDWVVVGGESGPGARPFDLAWARAIVEQCKAAEVPAFVKQIGTAPTLDGARRTPIDRKGGDMAEWPEDLRVRQFPEVRP